MQSTVPRVCGGLAKLTSLALGVFVGAALAVAIVSGSPLVWLDLLSTMKIAQLRPGEVDDTWMLWIEWRYALRLATLIAFIATPLWLIGVPARRRGFGSAALLGFSLSSIAALLTFAWAETTPDQKAASCLMYGCAGAIAGLITLHFDRLLGRWCGRFRRVN